MTNTCNHCNLEFKSATEARDGDTILMDTDRDERFHDNCWNQVEKDYRLKKDGKTRNTIYKRTDNRIRNGVGGGREDYLMYNWNTNQWVSVDSISNVSELGNPPSDKREREREREQKSELTLLFRGSDCSYSRLYFPRLVCLTKHESSSRNKLWFFSV